MKKFYIDEVPFHGTEEEFIAVKEFKHYKHCAGEYRISSDGRYEYYKGDTSVRHRDNGPAIFDPVGIAFWSIKGVGVVTGIIEVWFNNGKISRKNGPAMIYDNKTEDWYSDGVCFTDLFPMNYWFKK